MVKVDQHMPSVSALTQPFNPEDLTFFHADQKSEQKEENSLAIGITILSFLCVRRVWKRTKIIESEKK